MRDGTTTNKMKAQESKTRAVQPEKPNHYTYLKEFRVDQCQLFLQHKCTQHRPYTCFHWHFLNQRRRRPLVKKDGTFSYSPDVYCTKFDENTGVCPDGDDCPFLHRTAGDTERRYHLRYYKTGMCVHDTDSRGICVKNGSHCAFAHGVDDVRAPVNDIRELQAIDGTDHDGVSGIVGSLEKERNAVTEDPKWQDTAYVLANYKTEPCKRPPRLCRQGYACPQYHNSRDRRRPPKKFKYRSTACPNVKHGDEWGEPSNCDGGDSCQYCHSRTEQQFHPEIYKSTKCNDIQQNAYCPRGAFCAFAHVEHEMTQVRETAANENCTGTSFADIIQSALPPDKITSSTNNCSTNNVITSSVSQNSHVDGSSKINFISSTCDSLTNNITSVHSSRPHSVLPPIGSKPRRLSGSSNNSANSNSINTNGNNNISSSSVGTLKDAFGGFSAAVQGIGGVYAKAPGSEREDREAALRKQWLAIENDPSLDQLERQKQKQTFLVANNLAIGQNSMRGIQNNFISSNVSPLAPPFYPTSDTVQSVVGSALEEFSLEEPINLNASLDREFDEAFSNSLTGIVNSGLMGSSAPVNIPRPNYDRSVFGRSNTSPPSTSTDSFGHSLLHSSIKRENSLDQANSFLRAPNGTCITNSNSLQESLLGIGGGMSPHNPLTTGLSQSPLISSLTGIEMQRLREELLNNRLKLATWEEGIQQARSACQAWKREVDDAHRKFIMAEQSRDEALTKLNSQQKELEELRAGRLGHYLQALSPNLELEKVPLNTLKALQNRLKQDLIQVEKVINSYNMKSEQQWSGIVPAW